MVRSTQLVFGGAILLLGAASGQATSRSATGEAFALRSLATTNSSTNSSDYPSCTSDLTGVTFNISDAIGDGECHKLLNVEECGWDGGDCCASTCKKTHPEWRCKKYTKYCFDPAAPETCDTSSIGDGICDWKVSEGYLLDNNRKDCQYDGGDCCDNTMAGVMGRSCQERLEHCEDPDLCPIQKRLLCMETSDVTDYFEEHPSYNGNQMTVEGCRKNCSSHTEDFNNYSDIPSDTSVSTSYVYQPIFGLRGGNECWCALEDKTTDYYDLLPFKVGDENCNTSCSSNDGDTCGGIDYLEVFHSRDV